MPPESPPLRPARRAPMSLIPDGCNVGVVFRTLVALNGVTLLVCLIQAGSWVGGLSRFLEAAILLESASLTSLLALCAVRRPWSKWTAWRQRAGCVLVPTMLTAAWVYLLSWDSNLLGSLTNLTLLQGAVLGAFAGALHQHYFELRARAYSPALAEASLHALQARIQPHFLFNSLNAVLAMIRTEPQRAESTLEDLADLFRVLMRDARDVIALEDELRLCRQYLAIEHIRLGERLHVEWDTRGIPDEVLRRAQVPALLLQPLLENAVQYGVEPAQSPATVSIRLSRSLDRIEILISNSLPEGADSEPRTGNQMALENIRERLQLFYDVEAQLSVERSAERFEVRLRLPYVKGR